MNRFKLKIGAMALAFTAGLFALAPAGFAQDTTWKGFYVGANFGYGMTNGDTSFNPLPDAPTFINLLPQTLHPNPSGAMGGGQFGANWQKGHVVIGAEFDIDGAGISGTKILTPFLQADGVTPWNGTLTAHQETTWMATLRPRVGFTLVPRFLVYGTGGLAFGHVNDSANSDFTPDGSETYPAAVSKTKTGWTAGAGAEISLNKRWSVKGEYLYYDLGTQSVTADPSIVNPPYQVKYVWKTTANLVKFGINFRF